MATWHMTFVGRYSSSNPAPIGLKSNGLWLTNPDSDDLRAGPRRRCRRGFRQAPHRR